MIDADQQPAGCTACGECDSDAEHRAAIAHAAGDPRWNEGNE